MPYVIVGVFLLAVWVYAVLDVIRTDESLTQNLPKLVWLFVVVLLPTVGSFAWFLLGRPPGTSLRLGSPTTRVPRRPTGPSTRGPIGPDDDPRFLASLEERKRKEGWGTKSEGDDSSS